MSQITFRTQWERVNRHYTLFQEINSGILHNRETAYYEDILFCFFINCHHLKDWIKNDKRIPQKVRDQVETYVSANQPLLICADIANGTKHMVRRTRDIRSGEPRTVKSKEINLTLGSQQSKINLQYNINDGANNVLDAFSLATNCVKLWKQFLKTHSLI